MLKRSKPAIIFGLSFLLPILVLVLCYYFLNFIPFGDTSLLIMDMSNQYVEFFAGLKDIISSPSNLVYSWSMGFGGNIIGLVSYYISSPFSLITLFFSDETLPLGITVLTMLKIGLCGLTFSLFLKFKYKLNKYSIILFSVLYSLTAYNIGYSMCIMWLDSVIWLPLIILSVERIIDGKSIVPLVVFLFLAFISNYYSAYMIGIFSFLYFIYYYVANNNKRFFKLFVKFILSAVLSAGMSAFLLLPTVFCMLNGKIGGNGYTSDSTINYNPIILISKLMAGNSYDDITYSGTPFVYFGLFALVLFIVYFFIKKISAREKISAVLLISVILISSIITKIDVVWHAFQYPNWFPFRYMFVLPFFMILCAYRAYIELQNDFSIKNIIAPIIITIISFAVVSFYYKTALEILAINVILLVLLGFGLLVFQFRNKTANKIISIILLFVCLSEVTYNTVSVYTNLDKQFRYDNATTYSEFKSELTPIVNSIRSSDNSLYRIEKDFERSKNDSFGLTLNGIGHYSSAYDRNTNTFLKSLGFAQDYFWCSYLGSTPLTDSIFGVKYILSKYDGYEDYYNKISNSDDITVYKNPYALPFGFMANNSIMEYLELDTPLANQNRIIDLMTGATNNCFKRINNITAYTSGLDYNDELYTLSFTKKDEATSGYLHFEFTAQDSNNIYAYIPEHYSNTSVCEMYINDVFYEYLFTSDTDRVLSIGKFEKGEKVNIKILVDDSKLLITNYMFYSFDKEKFANAIFDLQKNQIDITEYNNTYIKGIVTATTHKSTLFTSIRDDNGWTVYVDGIKTDHSSFYDTLITIDLTEGEHKIELKFSPPGLLVGIIISIISVLIFTFLCIYTSKKQSAK